MGSIVNRIRAIAIKAAYFVGLLLLCFPAQVFARAGGGEGFHGGGGGGGGGGGHGGGGGGGGDGGGIGTLIWLLIQLIFRYPAVGVPLLIILILVAFFYFRQQTDPAQFAARMRQAQENPDDGLPVGAPPRMNSIDLICQRDPAFDLAAFEQRVGLAFNKIQGAWCAQDLRSVRPFISDGVHERFLLQIAEQKDEGYRDFMEGIRILDMRVIETESDGVYDEIALCIRAISVDYRISLATGKRVSGSGSPEQFEEVWTFLRRQGALTRTDRPGLIEGHCPNCGAPVEMNQSANCDHCKALLRSGQYDWVLTEITQHSEWHGVRHCGIPGTTELRQRDPDFNAADIEDRASVAFWRIATADRLGKADPIRKVASPLMVQGYEAMLHSGNGQPRMFWADCAVGSVQLIGIVPGDADDQAVVEITWNGHRFVAQPGQPPRPAGGETLFHTLLIFCRHQNCKTDVGKGVSSAHCPNCGAPESGGTSNSCDFCGTVLTDGAHGWVLTEFLPRLDPRAQGLLSQLHHAPVLS